MFNPEDVETEARIIAASKMGLIKDIYGKKLPDELWMQCFDEAVTSLQMRIVEEKEYNWELSKDV